MSSNSDFDWDNLIDVIGNRKCVLAIGPGVFANPTTDENLHHIIANNFVKNAEPYIHHFDVDDGVFLFKKSRFRRKTTRLLEEFYQKMNFPWLEQVYEMISKIPFSVILSLNPDTKLMESFDKERIPYSFDFYFRNRKASENLNLSPDRPIIYYLLGTITEPESLVLTEGDRFEYLESIFKGRSMSEEIRFKLESSEIFIFLGFRYEDWFTRILLRVLNLHRDKLQEIERIDISRQEKTLLVGRVESEFNIEFIPYDQYDFLRQLYDKCQDAGLSNPVEDSILIPDEFRSFFNQGRSEAKNRLVELIAAGKMETTLEALKEFSKLTNDKSFSNDVIVLNNRFKLLKQREFQGTIDMRDFAVENNQLVEKVLSLIDTIDPYFDNLTDNIRKKQFGLSELEKLKLKNNQLSQKIDQLEFEKEKKEERNVLEASAARKKQFSELRDKKSILDIHKDPSNHPLASEVSIICDKAYKNEQAGRLEQAKKLYESSIDIFEYYLPAWEGLERIYRNLNQEENRLHAAEKCSLIQDTIAFEKNVRNNTIVEYLQVKSIANFGDFTWELNPKINILLGKNGFGKSHLLRLITALLEHDQDITSIYFRKSDNNPFVLLQLGQESKTPRILRTKTMFQEKSGKIPILAIPDLRFVDRNKTSIRLGEPSLSNFRENGAFHFLQQIPYEGLIQTFLYELCIEYLDNKKSFDLEIFQLIESVVKELTDNQFTFHRIEAIGNAEFAMEVITEGNPNPLPIQYASQGTLSVLSIFGLIFNFLKAIKTEVSEKDIRYQSGIVIIDEIDAHLHPAWQKKIIDLLRKKFPNVQFIITAHSPMVVLGCREDEVAVLKKRIDEEGFFVEKYSKDFIGEEMDDILKEVFQLKETNDTFVHYKELIPKRDHIKNRISELSQRDDLSFKEQNELDTLLEDFYYLVKIAREEMDLFNND